MTLIYNFLNILGLVGILITMFTIDRSKQSKITNIGITLTLVSLGLIIILGIFSGVVNS